MEERIALFREYESGAFSVVELCARYGISRETFYVWRSRRASGDVRWFEERSRSPGHCPHAVAADVVAAIRRMRERFPSYGPKKIGARLGLDRPDVTWPAASTTGDVLKREGLSDVCGMPANSRRIGQLPSGRGLSARPLLQERGAAPTGVLNTFSRRLALRGSRTRSRSSAPGAPTWTSGRRAQPMPSSYPACPMRSDARPQAAQCRACRLRPWWGSCHLRTFRRESLPP